jgi:hypothetical protein
VNRARTHSSGCSAVTAVPYPTYPDRMEEML